MTKTQTTRKSRVKANVAKEIAMETVAAINDAQQITEEQATALLDAAAEGNSTPDLTTVVKEAKRRAKSARERDEGGKVLRKGRNLSGNQPFARKYYYLDLDFAKGPDYEKAFQAAPMQVRLMLKYMGDEGISTPDDAQIGAEICGGAIAKRYVQSKIDPAALFAYYRRVMERLGLRLAAEG